MSTLIILAVIVIIILCLVGYIVRWKNLPEVIEQKRIAAEAASKAKLEKMDARIEARQAQQKRRDEIRKQREEARRKRNE